MAESAQMQNIAIFSNPIAGKGKSRRLAQQLHEHFSKQGWKSELIFQRPTDFEFHRFRELTAAVAIGGDGTLRTVVELLTQSGQHSGPGILIIPVGTANLMGLHLGIDWHAKTLCEQAAHAIQRRQIAMLDLARVTHSTDGLPAHAAQHLCLLMVGVGIDGQIVHALDRVRRGPIGFSHYVLPTLAALAQYEFPAIEVEVDGRIVWPMSPAIAFAGNIAQYGWGMPLLPHARSDDGVLDVLILPTNRPADLIHHTMSAILGEHLHDEGAIYLKGTHIKIHANRPVPAQSDGDPAGFTRLQIQLLPTQVKFIVPPETQHPTTFTGN